MTSKSTIDTVESAEAMATTTTTSTGEPDLADRMRRLSVGSTGTAFSIISDAPSVRSLDTNGSVNGGVSVESPAPVEPPSIDILEICLEALTKAERASNPTLHDEDIADTTETRATGTKPQPEIEIPDVPATDISPYWSQFPGFVPNPSATFKKELARLAKHEQWSSKTKRKQQVKALSAEITYHYGTHKNKLDRWQQLCEDVGIDVVPKSIRQCRKTVSPVLVNLYNVIDHRRNPHVKVLRFKSYGEFCRYTRAGHTFPKECAKQDGFINVLLKKM